MDVRLGIVLALRRESATNSSAFTIFGLSGAGYRMGYSFSLRTDAAASGALDQSKSLLQPSGR
jgi:hypothetical protein